MATWKRGTEAWICIVRTTFESRITEGVEAHFLNFSNILSIGEKYLLAKNQVELELNKTQYKSLLYMAPEPIKSSNEYIACCRATEIFKEKGWTHDWLNDERWYPPKETRWDNLEL